MYFLPNSSEFRWYNRPVQHGCRAVAHFSGLEREKMSQRRLPRDRRVLNRVLSLEIRDLFDGDLAPSILAPDAEIPVEILLRQERDEEPEREAEDHHFDDDYMDHRLDSEPEESWYDSFDWYDNIYPDPLPPRAKMPDDPPSEPAGPIERVPNEPDLFYNEVNVSSRICPIIHARRPQWRP